MSDPPDARKTRPTVTIPGWPVLARGLLMTTVENVVFIHLDDRMSDAVFDTYLRALEASLSNRLATTRVAVVYDVPTFSGLRAMSARATGEIIERHRETLRETTACFALASPSMIARAAAQTVLTISRLPFPQRTFPALGAALAFVAAVTPGIDRSSVERRIDEALAAHRLRMRG